MTNDKHVDIQSALEQLKVGFIEKIPSKNTEIENAWAIVKSAPDDRETSELLHRLAHTLAGTAATFKLNKLAENAKAIENILQEFSNNINATLPVKNIELLLEKLKDTSTHTNHSSANITDTDELAFTIAPTTNDTPQNNLVYFVDDDEEFTHTTKIQIETFGYNVKTFTSLTSFSQALMLQEPAAVIMNVMFGNTKNAGIEFITAQNAERTLPLKTIFIAGSHDITCRLNAVRANGLAYFNKPVLTTSLVSVLDKISYKTEKLPYHVLIVDDSRTQAKQAAIVLQQAGMQTKEINDPLTILNALSEFSPDLILMDIYMPNCNGLELSQVIRQIENYVSIPIVFLSAEDDLNKKLGAISLGADDFLTKPVKPWHLISAVSSRALRGRLMRKLAETDGLTGLLNHSKSKECLSNEVKRAKRENKPVSFAMFDLDCFKKVNDVYGHPVGDRVLTSVANILKQRLRKYDIVGRYGGEEFIVILPNTDSHTAKKIIDVIRRRFSKLIHHSKEGGFCCTFSCGIAAYPDFDNEITISNEADKALYLAKNAGRNKVVCAVK